MFQMPFSFQSVASINVTLCIKEGPAIPAGRTCAMSFVVLLQAPVQVCGPTHISAISILIFAA